MDPSTPSEDSTGPSDPASAPQPERPTLPEGYGLPETTDGLLDWSQVEPRLIASREYWLASVRPDGRPHSVPRWGVWVGGRFWYDGAPTTRHARNVELNPAVTLTLESGTEVVIVEGDSRATRADPGELGLALSAAFAKYDDGSPSSYAPSPDAWAGEDGGGLRVITPHRALAWFDFPTDCTRFTFGSRADRGR
ncbi:pyridoxamine 5'-phosphate oxidase family protein [Ornithinimicrobium sp. Y1847]|uniref:pyridoxamine 5'-phosphate oxidase family protein n=1 Tax=unclassified Ornithinimicrobium TaxID=2615080 RepID=UPI003B6802BD